MRSTSPSSFQSTAMTVEPNGTRGTCISLAGRNCGTPDFPEFSTKSTLPLATPTRTSGQPSPFQSAVVGTSRAPTSSIKTG